MKCGHVGLGEFSQQTEVRIPGPGEKVLDAFRPPAAFLQLLWAQRLLWVRLHVALWDHNFVRFGQLHVGRTHREMLH